MISFRAVPMTTLMTYCINLREHQNTFYWKAFSASSTSAFFKLPNFTRDFQRTKSILWTRKMVLCDWRRVSLFAYGFFGNAIFHIWNFIAMVFMRCLCSKWKLPSCERKKMIRNQLVNGLNCCTKKEQQANDETFLLISASSSWRAMNLFSLKTIDKQSESNCIWW